MPNFRRVSAVLLDWGRPTPRADDLHASIKDDVFRWQTGSKAFARIDAETLLRADVCNNNQNAAKVIAACHKIGIVNSQTGHPDTSKIDRFMVNKMAVISERKQRELVMLLFFMEEEITRWRLLTQEEDEIKQKLTDDELDATTRMELEQGLAMMQDEKMVLPSSRDESGHIKESSNAVLPSYAEAERR